MLTTKGESLGDSRERPAQFDERDRSGRAFKNYGASALCGENSGRGLHHQGPDRSVPFHYLRNLKMNETIVEKSPKGLMCADCGFWFHVWTKRPVSQATRRNAVCIECIKKYARQNDD